MVKDYVVFDLETTGFSPENNRIIEIGAVKVQEGKITDKFSTFNYGNLVTKLFSNLKYMS